MVRAGESDKIRTEEGFWLPKKRACEFKTPFLEAILLYFLSSTFKVHRKGGQQTIHINSTLLGSGNSSLLCGMEKIELKKENTPQPA